jgi:WD40 repeat protein
MRHPLAAFKGHASHVGDVRFSADDRRVFSAGGHDRTLFQWKTHGVVEPSRHFKKEKKVRPPKGPVRCSHDVGRGRGGGGGGGCTGS